MYVIWPYKSACTGNMDLGLLRFALVIVVKAITGLIMIINEWQVYKIISITSPDGIFESVRLTVIWGFAPLFAENKTSYLKITRKLKVARLGIKILASFWNLTDASMTLLPGYLSNTTANVQGNLKKPSSFFIIFVNDSRRFPWFLLSNIGWRQGCICYMAT